MDLMESFRVFGRHRILTSVLLLLTLVGTVGAAIKMPWSYSAKATVVLLNSKSASAAAGGNPYLSFASSLTQAADVICLEVTDPGTGLVLQAHGYTAGYTAVVSSATGAPMIVVTTTGSDSNAVEHTLSGVTQQVNVKLHALQADVPMKDRITSKLISSDLHASHSISKKAKPLAVVLGLGLVLTYAIPHLVDSAARRRERRSKADRRVPGTMEDGYRDVPPADDLMPNGHRPRGAEVTSQQISAPRSLSGTRPDEAGQRWGDANDRVHRLPHDGRGANDDRDAVHQGTRPGRN